MVITAVKRRLDQAAVASVAALAMVKEIPTRTDEPVIVHGLHDWDILCLARVIGCRAEQRQKIVTMRNGGPFLTYERAQLDYASRTATRDARCCAAGRSRH